MKYHSRAVRGAAAFVLLAAFAFGQERKVVLFTGSGAPQPNPIPVRGLVKCQGAGNPAPADGLMPPWCPPGTQTSALGRILVGKWVTSDPNTTGDMRWYMNLNVDSATFTGSWWGSFLLDIPGKGTWEGWFWGESAATPNPTAGEAGNGGTFRLIGIGHGAFEQSSIMVEVYQPDFSKPATFVGRYLQLKDL